MTYFGNPIQITTTSLRRGFILIKMKNYETPKEAGYKYLQYTGGSTKHHLLKNLHTGKTEIFVANKNHAGWALIYKNTHLEFCSTLKD